MSPRSPRRLTLLALPWLLPAAWLPAAPLMAMGNPPSRPREVPLEVPVTDLGRNERLPESLRNRYRPITTGVVPAIQAGALGFPLAQLPQEQAPFGWRLAASRSDWRMHTGLDLIVPEGTPVLAALPGTVGLVDEVAGYGLLVVIDHGLGWQSLYAHLLDVAVLPGASVAAGQSIGPGGQKRLSRHPPSPFRVASAAPGSAGGGRSLAAAAAGGGPLPSGRPVGDTASVALIAPFRACPDPPEVP